jgi:hypothetical protein
MRAGQNKHAILVTGAHRSGTTWVGKMLACSWRTWYIGEILRPDTQLLRDVPVRHWYQYITASNGNLFAGSVARILALNFVPPHRRAFLRFLPSRLLILKRTRNWFGLPRPIVKDPFLAFSLEWLAETFQVDIICLIRHPAAFVASLRTVNWRFSFQNFVDQPDLVGDWLYPFAAQLEDPPEDPVEEAALLWLCINQVLTSLIGTHPRWKLWRLEDLGANPLQEFQAVFEHVKLPYTRRIRQSIESYSTSGNIVEPPPDDPHVIRRDSRAVQQRWQSLLSSNEIARIRNIVEPVSHAFYSDSEW